MKYSNFRFFCFLLLSTAFFTLQSCNPLNKPLIKVTYSDELGSSGFDGRLLVLISKDTLKEPRFQINDSDNSAVVVGNDVKEWMPGTTEVFSSETLAYPIEKLGDLDDGDYYVQALLNKYETFNLSNGYDVSLPMDQGEGQKWNISPKNIYSKPTKVNFSSNKPIEIQLSEEIPPIPSMEDTKYIKHVKIQSKLLTEFWGRPMYLQANVLIPEDFSEKGKTEYPLMVFHGHFPKTIGGFRTSPPTANKNDTIYSERFGITGYKFIQEKESYDFYKKWTSKNFPRFLVIEIQHQNPYYDDSYAVNSANLGPYGDAITFELIPHIEDLFNGVGEGWGRLLF
jgi:hypothetical protein